MGIPNCSHCRKGQVDKEEIIKANTPYDTNYNSETTPNPPKKYDTPSQESYKKNINSIFKSKINEIGKFIPNKEFTSLIPEETNNFMIENAFDINKYISENKDNIESEPVEFFNGNIYKGNWNQNTEMDGYGQYILKNDDVFVEGIWDKGILKVGRIFLPNGEIYEGQIENSLFHGQGKLINKNGDIYEGTFKNGEKNDYGKIIFNDGCIYEGYLINDNIPNGKGEFKWIDNENINTNIYINYNFYNNSNNNYIYSYNGNFVKGQIDGFGILKNEKSGSEYKGNFKRNLFDGKGVFKWGNNDIIYDGEYKNGKKNGNGNYTNNNFKYSGYFNNGVPHGVGLVDSGNKIYKCTWRNGFTVEYPCLQSNNNSSLNENVNINFNPEDEDIDFNKLKHLKVEDMKYADFTPNLAFSEIIN